MAPKISSGQMDQLLERQPQLDDDFRTPTGTPAIIIEGQGVRDDLNLLCLSSLLQDGCPRGDVLRQYQNQDAREDVHNKVIPANELTKRNEEITQHDLCVSKIMLNPH